MYTLNVSAYIIHADAYYMRIGIYKYIYISIYICNVYIDIFTGESHMKASQGHDMRRAN